MLHELWQWIRDALNRLQGTLNEIWELIKRLLQQQGDPEKITEPGFEGDLPGDFSYDTYLQVTIYSNLPDPIVDCDQPYTITVRTKAEVQTCEGYNYQNLYDQALWTAEARLNPIRCPEECKQKIWIIAHQTSCHQIDEERAVVSAAIKLGIGCEQFPGSLPRGEQLPQNNDFAAPFSRPQDTQEWDMSPDERYVESTYPTTVNCPAKLDYQVTLFRPVKNCSVDDYRPLIEEAKQIARARYNAISCASGCTKEPIEIHRVTWNCISEINEIQVMVYFSVKCEN